MLTLALALLEPDWLRLGTAVAYLAVPVVALTADRPRSVVVDDDGITVERGARGIRGRDEVRWHEVADVAPDERRTDILVHTVDGRRISTGLDPGPDRDFLALWRRRRRG